MQSPGELLEQQVCDVSTHANQQKQITEPKLQVFGIIIITSKGIVIWETFFQKAARAGGAGAGKSSQEHQKQRQQKQTTLIRQTCTTSKQHFLGFSPKNKNSALGSCYLEPEIGAREQLVLSAHVFKHIIVLCRLHEASKQDIVQLTGVKRHVRATSYNTWQRCSPMRNTSRTNASSHYM